LLYDSDARQIIARDHIEMLHADFPAPRRAIRAAVGRRLMSLGARLAHEEAPRLAYRSARLPSGAPQ